VSLSSHPQQFGFFAREAEDWYLAFGRARRRSADLLTIAGYKMEMQDSNRKADFSMRDTPRMNLCMVASHAVSGVGNACEGSGSVVFRARLAKA
jgi:hypothetical protein